ncbi:hypothetical protein AXK12_07040 [Cephaloticoccus capnophilus]|uniref:Uncharacterized protein n=1 Tax=Cephaloticoccus capnophilus TaxID=1548208 RepID=A0A139SJL1_9BACT|nr:hypothetical protein AXK12_07040 [Cephaloticoccus capnophilus]
MPVRFASEPNRDFEMPPPILSQRDRENTFKFGISLSRDSAMRNPKLNGCSDTLPPHAQWSRLLSQRASKN